MAKRKNGKYSKELEQMRMLKSINSMLKSSDMENALLSNSAKDSETMPDGMVDEMLGKISAERERNKAIFDVERMTAEATGSIGTQVRRSSHPRSAKRSKHKARTASTKRQPRPKGKAQGKRKRR